jgi:hypothetical protein
MGWISVDKTVVRGPPAVRAGSPGGLLQFAGGFGRRNNYKNGIRRWTNENYTFTHLC